MIAQKIKHILSSALGLRKKEAQPAYPFTWKNESYPVTFNINNDIENFRLKGWGGEKEYVIKLLKTLKPSDVFYDIGSSVGLISILAAHNLKQGKVISFEPDPENLDCLKKNYAVNNLNNYSIMPMAVGDKKDKLKLFTAGSNGYSPSLQQVNGIQHHIEVEVNSIDNLLLENRIPYPTVVKIDIEGAEMMALQGMKHLLQHPQKPKLIFIEIHPDFLPSFNTSADAIFKYLSGFDYYMEERIERDKQILCKLVSK